MAIKLRGSSMFSLRLTTTARLSRQRSRSTLRDSIPGNRELEIPFTLNLPLDKLANLRVRVDSSGVVSEMNESDNSAQIPVDVAAAPDAPKPPNTQTALPTWARFAGAFTVANLNLHNAFDRYSFRFRLTGTGGAGDFFKAIYDGNGQSHLHIDLFDSNGVLVAQLSDDTDPAGTSLVSLSALPAGVYSAVVYSADNLGRRVM